MSPDCLPVGRRAAFTLADGRRHAGDAASQRGRRWRSQQLARVFTSRDHAARGGNSADAALAQRAGWMTADVARCGLIVSSMTASRPPTCAGMTLERPTAFVSTGVPPPDRVRMLIDDAHARFASVDEGRRRRSTPRSLQASPELFGICVVGARGGVYGVGDADVEFTIMSVAKPFVFALVCAVFGPRR